MITDDKQLVKLKSAGVPITIIAARMGLTVEQVEQRWSQILKDVAAKESNGYLALCDAFHILANQYQLVGESLKIIGNAIGNVMPADEVAKHITSDPQETLDNLRRHTIILRPFIPITPEESLKQTVKGN